jgi:hypothetical protein
MVSCAMFMHVGLCAHHVGPECVHVNWLCPPAVSKASGLISFEALLPGCSTSCMPSYTAKYTPKLGQSLTRVTAVPLHSPACCAYLGVPLSVIQSIRQSVSQRVYCLWDSAEEAMSSGTHHHMATAMARGQPLGQQCRFANQVPQSSDARDICWFCKSLVLASHLNIVTTAR